MKKIMLLLGFISLVTNAQIVNNPKEIKSKNIFLETGNEFRNWWDVTHYKISVETIENDKFISGDVEIKFDVVKQNHTSFIQIDLQQPMKITTGNLNGKKINISKIDGDYYLIDVSDIKLRLKGNILNLSYEGKPKIAIHAPWDGGWIFTKDKKNRSWISAAVQELGASAWFPNKDDWADEADEGIELKIISPKNLVGIGNGRLIKKEIKNEKNISTWDVVNPINNYDIIPYVGNYTNFKDSYQGEKGKLDLDYYVLDYNLDKAKKQFQQVKLMLKSFEYWFGSYPFYEDSYKIIEAPHLGMEHQSGIAYGNNYENGYLGGDLSDSGWGKKWDFIIIHESGHEWFGNNITAKDIAEMWIHEAFTSYSETLFTETYYGKKAASEYVIGTRKLVKNDNPVIGKYGIKNSGSGDMYFKGANMIHTLRTWMNNDDKFRQILRGLNKDFYHQTVTSEQIENYIEKISGLNLKPFFNQYLRSINIPTLELRQNGENIEYRYKNVVENFAMPLRISETNKVIYPTKEWQTLKNYKIHRAKDLSIDPNYYINIEIN